MSSKKIPGDATQPSVVLKEIRPIHDGFLKLDTVRVRHRRFDGAMTGTFSRELVRRTPAVAILPYDRENDRVVLIEQFRIGCLAETTPWCIEVCAGLIDEGESPEQAAQREMAEETGCTPTELLPIGRYYPSPGACDEVIQLYCGLIDNAPTESTLQGVAGENEDIRTLPISADAAEQLVAEGRITNATTLIALQWLWRYRHEQKKVFPP